MATYIKGLADKDGNIVNPRTSIEAVEGLSDALSEKQESLTAGDGIAIDNNVISATRSGTVTDVKLDGTSVTSNGVANINIGASTLVHTSESTPSTPVSLVNADTLDGHDSSYFATAESDSQKVSYTESQTMTSQQKAIARQNLGVNTTETIVTAGVNSVNSLTGDAILDGTNIKYQYSDASSLTIKGEIDGLKSQINDETTGLDAKAPVIINTASGAIATFTDGANGMPVKKLVVQIEPVQAGTGEQSPTNIRAISGHTKCDIIGPKNQFSENVADWKTGYYLGNTGAESSSNNWKYSQFYFPVLPNTTYAVSLIKNSVANVGISVAIYNSSKVFLRRDVFVLNTTATGPLSGSFTTQQNDAYIRINVPNANTENIQIEVSSTPTAYVNQTVEVDWQSSEAGTVYGGTLTVDKDSNVKLVSDKDKINLSDLTWQIATGSQGRSYYLSSAITGAKVPTDNTEVVDLTCECFKTESAYNVYTGSNGIGLASNNRFRVYDGTSDLTTFQTLINGKAVVYPVVNPTETVLPAVEMPILSGKSGYVWASTGDIINLAYPADTTDIINSIENKLNPVADHDAKYFKTGKTLVTFGDSIFGMNAENGAGVGDFIAKSSGMNVINVAFGGTRMVKRSDDIQYSRCAFDFENLVNAVVSDESDPTVRFADQLWAIEHNPEAQISYYADRLNTLAAVDFSQVDYVTLNYGTNDWTANTTTDDYVTAYKSTLATFLTKFPHIRVYIVTPTYRLWYDSETQQFIDDSNTREFGPTGDTTTLDQFAAALEDVKTDLNLPIIDCYHIGINQYTWMIYFTPVPSAQEVTHHDVAGRAMLGDIIARYILAH